MCVNCRILSLAEKVLWIRWRRHRKLEVRPERVDNSAIATSLFADADEKLLHWVKGADRMSIMCLAQVLPVPASVQWRRICFADHAEKLRNIRTVRIGPSLMTYYPCQSAPLYAITIKIYQMGSEPEQTEQPRPLTGKPIPPAAVCILKTYLSDKDVGEFEKDRGIRIKLLFDST